MTMKSTLVLIALSLLVALSAQAATSVTRLKDIPEQALNPCRDSDNHIAEIGASWAGVGKVSKLPKSRLISACHHSPTEWVVVCELGGRGHDFEQVTLQRASASEPWPYPSVKRLITDPKHECK